MKDNLLTVAFLFYGRVQSCYGRNLSWLADSLVTSVVCVCVCVCVSTYAAKSKSETEVHRSGVDNDPNSSAPFTKSTAIKKEKKVKKKDGKAKGSVDGPPPESMQLPPGPMVALGRPKEKSVKRARSVKVAGAFHRHLLWPT